MLAIMLDLCFENMEIIWDFVGDVQVTKIVVEYDVKMVHVIFCYKSTCT
jgi:hypothetical protein